MLAIHNTDAVSQSEHRANDYIYRQTDRQRQTDKDRQTDADRQADRKTDMQTGRRTPADRYD